MVKFSLEDATLENVESEFISCHCLHTLWIKKLVCSMNSNRDEVEKKGKQGGGGRRGEREREMGWGCGEPERERRRVLPTICLVPGLQALELSVLWALPASVWGYAPWSWVSVSCSRKHLD